MLDAGAGNNFYLWSTGETTQAIIASITASYSVVVADSIGCKNSDTVRVTINTLPLVTLNSIGNSDTLCMSWGNVNLNNGVPVGGTYSGSGVSGNSFNPSSAGVGWHTIFYSYTDSTGCNNFTSRAVYVTVCTGINQLNSIDKIKIYPNPIISGNDLTLIYNTRTNTLSTFNIYDVSGRNVFSKPILSSNETQTITLPILAIGVYDCVINSANGCSHQKLVIMD